MEETPTRALGSRMLGSSLILQTHEGPAPRAAAASLPTPPSASSRLHHSTRALGRWALWAGVAWGRFKGREAALHPSKGTAPGQNTVPEGAAGAQGGVGSCAGCSGGTVGASGCRADGGRPAAGEKERTQYGSRVFWGSEGSG